MDRTYNNFVKKLFTEEPIPEEEDDSDYCVNEDIFSHGWRFDPHEGINRPIELIDLNAKTEFSRKLNLQLRQHVQMLTQLYLMTRATSLSDIANEKLEQLREIGTINDGRMCPVNYKPAMELIRKYPIQLGVKPSIRHNWRSLPLESTIIEELNRHREIFIYRGLYPTVAFSQLPEMLKPRRKKVLFTPHEDQLLAYALQEFKDVPTNQQYKLISTLLMAAKSPRQVADHVKNLKRKECLSKNNPIQIYHSTKCVPKVDHSEKKFFSLLSGSNKSFLEPSISSQPPIVHNDNTNFVVAVTPKSIPQSNQLADLMDDNAIDLIVDDFIDRGGMNVASDKFIDDDDDNNNNNDDEDDNEDDDNMMDMAALMAASTTISSRRQATGINQLLSSTNMSDQVMSKRDLRALKQRKSMLYLMSNEIESLADLSDSGKFHNAFQELIINYYLKQCELRLSSQENYAKLLRKFTQTLQNHQESQNQCESFRSIFRFFQENQAPRELSDALCLFMTAEQAKELNCSLNHLYWMKFLQFMRYVILYTNGEVSPMTKLYRCVLALCKQRAGQHDIIGTNTGFELDSNERQKIIAAVSRIFDSHPFLMREFNLLFLDQKPHHSMLENFNDGNCEDISRNINSENLAGRELQFEEFELPPTKEEIKLAARIKYRVKCNDSHVRVTEVQKRDWTFEEDRSLLEFCQSKVLAAGNSDHSGSTSNSVDTAIFQEYAARQKSNRDVKEVAERFYHLVELYVDSMEQT